MIPGKIQVIYPIFFSVDFLKILDFVFAQFSTLDAKLGNEILDFQEVVDVLSFRRRLFTNKILKLKNSLVGANHIRKLVSLKDAKSVKVVIFNIYNFENLNSKTCKNKI